MNDMIFVRKDHLDLGTIEHVLSKKMWPFINLLQFRQKRLYLHSKACLVNHFLIKQVTTWSPCLICFVEHLHVTESKQWCHAYAFLILLTRTFDFITFFRMLYIQYTMPIGNQAVGKTSTAGERSWMMVSPAWPQWI